jgi:hypothetical protein
MLFGAIRCLLEETDKQKVLLDKGYDLLLDSVNKKIKATPELRDAFIALVNVMLEMPDIHLNYIKENFPDHPLVQGIVMIHDALLESVPKGEKLLGTHTKNNTIQVRICKRVNTTDMD